VTPKSGDSVLRTPKQKKVLNPHRVMAVGEKDIITILIQVGKKLENDLAITSHVLHSLER